MPLQRSRLRSLRRELQQQWRENPRAATAVVLLAGLGSTVLAGWLWSSQVLVLQNQQRQRFDTHRGLLDLRITGHRVTALDWGHWTPLYRYAGGEDSTFVEREVVNSSIIRDGQLLVIVGKDGSLRRLPEAELPAGLSSCLRQRLAILRQRTAPGDAPGRTDTETAAFGLLCGEGPTTVLGGATAILPSDGIGPERGWLLHLSQIERPSYNQAVNEAFRTIANTLVEADVGATPGSDPARDPGDVASISELLPDQRRFVLIPLHSPMQRGLLAMERALLPWLMLNALLLSTATVGMLGMRRLRREHLRSKRHQSSRLRQLQRDLNGRLLTPLQLEQALTGWDLLTRRPETVSGDAQAKGWWIAAIRLRVEMFGADFTRSRAHTQALRLLAEALECLDVHRLLALNEESQLLWVMQTTAVEATAAAPSPLPQLQSALWDLQRHLAGTIQLGIQCLFCPLECDALRQQLTDLALVLGSQMTGAPMVQECPQGVRNEAHQLRLRQQLDFDIKRLVDNLQQHRYRLEPVLAVPADPSLPSGSVVQGDLVYSEMLFRLPEVMEQDLTVQDLILSLERNNNVHQIDQLMLRTAIRQLQMNGDPRYRLGINLSALTLSADQRFEELMALLQALPELVLHRLVLEVTETAIVEQSDLWTLKLQRLRNLGIRIAIDDFGVGFASVAYLFRFQPDFIKLDLSYSQRTGDRNVDALVTFLLAYATHNHCRLILEGIETDAQLRYWHGLGVRLFQGHLLSAVGDGA